MGISSISQIDISSVCFECLTNDGSMRTIKTKSYLNSLSLLTVSRFIHHLRRETVSQTLYSCEPRWSFWLYQSCLISISEIWPYSLFLFCHVRWLWRNTGQMLLSLPASFWPSDPFICPWIHLGSQPHGEAEAGTSCFSLWCPKPLLGKREKWGHWCCSGSSWKRRSSRGWIIWFPISVLPSAISML